MRCHRIPTLLRLSFNSVIDSVLYAALDSVLSFNTPIQADAMSSHPYPNKKGARRRPLDFPASTCPLAHVTLAAFHAALNNDNYRA